MTEPVAREHDHEPLPGLPERPPEGEFIVWQGRPSGRLVARRILKTRWLAGYFVLLAGWAALAGYADGRTAGSILFAVGVLALLGAIGLALFELFGLGVQKTTLYTITNARIVMRIGVGLSITLNVPFANIASAAVQRERDGSGTITLALKEDYKFSWLMLWPHNRPWRFARPEPALICLADVDRVAALLAAELEKTVGVADRPAGRPACADIDGEVLAAARLAAE
ncbi:photosynthetic complex putative assembly protein PuhB [Aquibium sp. A9E412]|uniref:photosynthetic complex putative assembly protein PuhB n=1 Tax=Aquibium sp. A9E412 TaxID=2976767 RepID=UPI0025B22FFA|nr:photosynthetic complex putative assembly protein PuhB [Aquibium sp. A9E412]MDN2566058.1 photosynthetic complex putative assembly protein PuhB [Aquibium sp. A9E412]